MSPFYLCLPYFSEQVILMIPAREYCFYGLIAEEMSPLSCVLFKDWEKE